MEMLRLGWEMYSFSAACRRFPVSAVILKYLSWFSVMGLLLVKR
jgi:hypothetical protein